MWMDNLIGPDLFVGGGNGNGDGDGGQQRWWKKCLCPSKLSPYIDFVCVCVCVTSEKMSEWVSEWPREGHITIIEKDYCLGETKSTKKKKKKNQISHSTHTEWRCRL